MEKHAYCILVHNEPELFCLLIKALDDVRNDIFVHVDRKADITPFLNAQCHYGSLYFINQRINCKWGTISLVKAEFSLFAEARKHERYNYYHLLSGQDFPIKSQDYIHNYVQTHPGENYIGYVDESLTGRMAERAEQYHLLIRRPGSSLKSAVFSRFRKGFVILQQRLHIIRHFPFPIKKGAQWVSLSDDFCAYLLDNSDFLLHLFRHTYCPDEMVIHSFFASSPFAGTQHQPGGGEYEQCLREIDWDRGSPYTWQEEDLGFLMSSEKWFARKVSSSHIALIDLINESIQEEKDKTV